MHHPTDKITHTTAFVTPVVEHWLKREIAQCVHHMKDRSDDPRATSERSYNCVMAFSLYDIHTYVHTYIPCDSICSRAVS